ncbi:MAG: hypothetical protein M3024_04135 [Candidatus Dormibacteraeota bacterium]|nr:hypothetical protein [Candidatus Dormibacteraeota bacterium]
MDVMGAEAERLRQAAEARPLRLPVNRRIDERHHAEVDGLQVWFTQQLTAHNRIWEVLFERSDRTPEDAEVEGWLKGLLPDRKATEAVGLPGSLVRRFEVFEPLP